MSAIMRKMLHEHAENTKNTIFCRVGVFNNCFSFIFFRCPATSFLLSMIKQAVTAHPLLSLHVCNQSKMIQRGQNETPWWFGLSKSAAYVL